MAIRALAKSTAGKDLQRRYACRRDSLRPRNFCRRVKLLQYCIFHPLGVGIGIAIEFLAGSFDTDTDTDTDTDSDYHGALV